LLQRCVQNCCCLVKLLVEEMSGAQREAKHSETIAWAQT
jgi:hypothetical protein